jgi:hypothetical protein
LVKLHAGCQNAATVAVDGVPHVDPKGKVLAVGEARKSLARACEELGVERLTHHDLRDAFATAAIEAGVDIPTVAAWLGHAYGGALLICVYGVIDPVQRAVIAAKETRRVGLATGAYRRPRALHGEEVLGVPPRALFGCSGRFAPFRGHPSKSNAARPALANRELSLIGSSIVARQPPVAAPPFATNR